MEYCSIPAVRNILLASSSTRASSERPTCLGVSREVRSCVPTCSLLQVRHDQSLSQSYLLTLTPPSPLCPTHESSSSP